MTVCISMLPGPSQDRQSQRLDPTKSLSYLWSGCRFHITKGEYYETTLYRHFNDFIASMHYDF